MKKYKLYFEFYGKKMKTTVTAKNEHEAVQIVNSKIFIIKIVPEPKLTLDEFKNAFGM